MELPYTLQLPPISLQKAKSSTELLSFDAPERKIAFTAYTAPGDDIRKPQTWKVGAEFTIPAIQFSLFTSISLNSHLLAFPDKCWT